MKRVNKSELECETGKNIDSEKALQKNEPLMRIRGLSKTYKTGFDKTKTPISVVGLEDVSLDINRGEFIAVIGVSASGKSTLIHCLGSFERPDPESDGCIEYLDKSGSWKNIWADPDWYRQNFIGIVFQAFHLLQKLKVWQNVALPLQLKRCQRFSPSAFERRQRASEVLGDLEIADKRDVGMNQLAGGEIQRVAIARAMIKRPQLVLADEPTGNLDGENKQNIVKKLKELTSQGVTVLMVTHDKELVKEGIADRIIEISDGRIVSDKTMGVKTEKNKNGIEKGSDDMKVSLKNGTSDNELSVTDDESTNAKDAQKQSSSEFAEGVKVETGQLSKDKLGQLGEDKYDPNIDCNSSDVNDKLESGELTEDKTNLSESDRSFNSTHSEQSVVSKDKNAHPVNNGHCIDKDHAPEADKVEHKAEDENSTLYGANNDSKVEQEDVTQDDSIEDVTVKNDEPGLPSKIVKKENEKESLESQKDFTTSDGDKASAQVHGPTADSEVEKCLKGEVPTTQKKEQNGIFSLKSKETTISDTYLKSQKAMVSERSMNPKGIFKFSQTFGDLLSFATKDAVRNKVSLISNIGAILFGTVFTSILIALLVGVDDFIDKITIPDIDTLYVAVDLSTGADPISEREFMDLGKLPGAICCVPNINQFAIAFERDDRDTIIALASATRDDPVLKRLNTLSGRAEVDPEGWEIIIPEAVAEEINNFNPLGLTDKMIKIVLRRYKNTDSLDDMEISKEVSFQVRVVGVVQDTPDSVCYGSLNMVRLFRDFGTGRSENVPEQKARVDLSKISDKTMFEGVRVHFSRAALASEAYEDIRSDRSSRFQAHWPGTELRYLRDIQLIATLVLVLTGVLAIIAGSISIFNTLAASVARKAKDFGILRALGFGSKDIFFIVQWQAVLMGGIAGVLGLIAAWISSSALNEKVIEQWPELADSIGDSGLFQLPILYAIGIFLIVITVCVCAGIIPSWQASKRTPIDALRSND